MENKKFYKTFFCLMIPMALKELISSLVNLVDTVMCGQLGESSIAAVGIGNQVFFLFTVFLFGIGSGAGVFSSQFWGNSDTKGMRKILGLNLILGVILSAVFTAAAWIFPVQIFEAFHADAETMAQGIVYLRIVSVGYIATAITSAFDYSVCASERASLPFLVRTIGLFINIFFNWIFIFGKFSPCDGVERCRHCDRDCQNFRTFDDALCRLRQKDDSGGGNPRTGFGSQVPLDSVCKNLLPRCDE